MEIGEYYSSSAVKRSSKTSSSSPSFSAVLPHSLLLSLPRLLYASVSLRCAPHFSRVLPEFNNALGSRLPLILFVSLPNSLKIPSKPQVYFIVFYKIWTLSKSDLFLLWLSVPGPVCTCMDKTVVTVQVYRAHYRLTPQLQTNKLQLSLQRKVW